METLARLGGSAVSVERTLVRTTLDITGSRKEHRNKLYCDLFIVFYEGIHLILILEYAQQKCKYEIYSSSYYNLLIFSTHIFTLQTFLLFTTWWSLIV